MNKSMKLIIAAVLVLAVLVTLDLTITGQATKVSYFCNWEDWPNSVVVKGTDEVVYDCASSPGRPFCNKNMAIAGRPECCKMCTGAGTYTCTDCVSVVPTCSDSDGGKEYFTKGSLAGSKVLMWDYALAREDACYYIEGNSRFPTEQCEGGDKCILYEKTCEGTVPTTWEYRCPYGCKYGACANSTAEWV